MSKINEVKEVALTFLKKEVGCYDPKAIKIEEVDKTWEVQAEVYEDDTFLKSLNFPPKKVRQFYSVSLDSDLEVRSYKRLDSYKNSNHTE